MAFDASRMTQTAIKHRKHRPLIQSIVEIIFTYILDLLMRCLHLKLSKVLRPTPLLWMSRVDFFSIANTPAAVHVLQHLDRFYIPCIQFDDNAIRSFYEFWDGRRARTFDGPFHSRTPAAIPSSNTSRLLLCFPGATTILPSQCSMHSSCRSKVVELLDSYRYFSRLLSAE